MSTISQTVGLAGWKYGLGRVAAFTKAINFENISGNEDESLFTRLFLNACLWATLNRNIYQYSTRTAAIIKTNNTTFDNRLYDLLYSLGIFQYIEMENPWYLEDINTSALHNLYVLIPSYSAFDGNKMPDTRQNRFMSKIRDTGCGLVIGEWFHLLQSITSKRSFSFSYNNNDGLFKVSPLKIERNFLIFSKTKEILYSELVADDSFSSTLPKTFNLTNVLIDTPFDGHITQINDVNNEAIIYWSTDLSGSATTTTTTTTTTAIPATEEIKMKIGELNLINSCGPQKLFLDGPYKNYFSLEGKDLYLTKYIQDEQKILLNVVAEDYFVHKRFNDIVETLEIDFINCFAPISRPKDGSGPAFSFRNTSTLAWGKFAPKGVISPFEDYFFIGEGKSENPVIVSLGGTHSDYNALWMQVNNGGTITYTLTPSMEQRENYFFSDFGDVGALFLIRNTTTSNIKPTQHLTDIFDYQYQYSQDVFSILAQVNGTTSITGSVNIPDPNTLNSQGNRIRGDVFLVLYLRKDIIRSELDDRIYGTIYFGSTTTTPPPTFDFNVIVQNNIPQSSTSVSTLKFTNIAQTNINLTQFFTLFANPNLVLSNVTVSDNSQFITAGISSNVSDWEKSIFVRLDSMPAGGGTAIVTLNGSVNTTTTTPPPVSYSVTVIVKNAVSNVTVNNLTGNDPALFDQESTYTTNFPNGNYSVTFYYNTDFGYEYRDNNKPSINEIEDDSNLSSGATVNRTNNTQGNINIPITINNGGGTVKLELSPPNPVPTTTTTTTTTPAPCDNLIYIICEQVLDCIDSNGNCIPSINSFQRLVYSTCCQLTESEVMSIIRNFKQASPTATLEDMYGSQCPTSNFEYLAPCSPKDNDGNCQETIHYDIIETISCASNPLP